MSDIAGQSRMRIDGKLADAAAGDMDRANAAAR